MTEPNYLRIEGDRLRCLISNAHSLLYRQFKEQPLWSMVSSLTGHGCTVSTVICQHVGYDPDQLCGNKQLKKL